MTRGASEANESPSRAPAPTTGQVLEVAQRACTAAVAAGAIDWLQAEAMLAALDPDPEPGIVEATRATLVGVLSAETSAVGVAVGSAISAFQDGDPEPDLEEMAAMLAELESRARRLVSGTYDPGRPSKGGAAYASRRWLGHLEVACRHLKEAGDLVDDGMPGDDVCFELGAAAAALRAALSNPDPPSG